MSGYAQRVTDDVEQFASEFVQFMRSMHEAAERRPVRRAFRERIDEFLGVESRSLPVIADAFAAFDHVNVQVAMSAYLGRKGRSHELLGMFARELTSSPQLIAGEQ